MKIRNKFHIIFLIIIVLSTIIKIDKVYASIYPIQGVELRLLYRNDI